MYKPSGDASLYMRGNCMYPTFMGINKQLFHGCLADPLDTTQVDMFVLRFWGKRDMITILQDSIPAPPVTTAIDI